jgi:Mycothiol maleylpyruvate isomerase N-terminal domain/Putative zinc-finger
VSVGHGPSAADEPPRAEGRATPPDPAPGTAPRVPQQRDASGASAARSANGGPPAPDHATLRSLLGAWALHACPAEESEAVERHLPQCPACADEAERLRDAVRWLSPDDPLDLDPLLRARVLEGCLGRRPARVPVPEWAAPYTAETARLDALLGSLGTEEWDTTVTVVWLGGSREFTVSGVLGHLAAVDGLVAAVLGLADPLGEDAPRDIEERTDAFGRLHADRTHDEVRTLWRRQTHSIVRTAAFAGSGAGQLSVNYGDFALPMRESFLDRAFGCWIHADDIARAVDYPYDAPASDHLRMLIDTTARSLPAAVADRRRQGLATSRGRLVEAGAPGRSVRLEIEGPGGGDYYVPLDSPAAVASPEAAVAHIALDGVEFCQLAAGHRNPEAIAVGVEGDVDAVRDVLYAAASLSRM